jgi:hypothetical protein
VRRWNLTLAKKPFTAEIAEKGRDRSEYKCINLESLFYGDFRHELRFDKDKFERRKSIFFAFSAAVLSDLSG